MNSTLKTGGDFCYASEKGQTFNQYSEETKKEAVRLGLEEGWTYSRIMEKFGIRVRPDYYLGTEKPKWREF